MIGYCTNAHGGNSVEELYSAIENTYAPICNAGNYGVGLWVPHNVIDSIDSTKLQETLHEHNVTVLTMNGFPYANFHADVVKHSVYRPHWGDPKRLLYTKKLATLLANITTKEDIGISTVPLCWNSDTCTNEDSAKALQQCVSFLATLEDTTGVCVHIDIETEPGCRLQRAKDLAQFMNEYFGDDEKPRRYLRVCHDTCHGAVMFEDVNEMVDQYNSAGLQIGKVQLSNALEIDFEKTHDMNVAEEVASFIEPKYLHQTHIQYAQAFSFHENLSKELLEDPSGLWRIHFHVPIHLQSIGHMQTTQHELVRAIPVLKKAGATCWEVETYTWGVMPNSLKPVDIVQSMTKELEWAERHINE